MTLKTKHIRLAKDPLCLSPFLDKSRRPEHVAEHARQQLRQLGYTLRRKRGPSGWKTKRMSTTLRRVVWLGVNFDERAPIDQAALLMHELCHARQMRVYSRFLARYIADSRFRWAMEAQAYRESVRAMRSMGAPKQRIRNYSHGRAEAIIRGYFILGRRLRRAIRKNTEGIVRLK